MLTFSLSSPTPTSLLVAPRLAWLAALAAVAEAVGGALAALLLGGDGIDPAAGISI